MAVGRRGPNKKRGPKTKSKWRDEYITIIPELIKAGRSILQVAKILKVNPDTIHDWKNTNEKFSDSLTKAQDDYNCGKVEHSMLKRAHGFRYTETTQEPDEDGNMVTVKKVRKMVVPETGAITFFLKNRKPERWQDKQDHNITVETYEERVKRLLEAIP